MLLGQMMMSKLSTLKNYPTFWGMHLKIVILK